MANQDALITDATKDELMTVGWANTWNYSEYVRYCNWANRTPESIAAYFMHYSRMDILCNRIPHDLEH